VDVLHVLYALVQLGGATDDGAADGNVVAWNNKMNNKIKQKSSKRDQICTQSPQNVVQLGGARNDGLTDSNVVAWKVIKKGHARRR